MATPILATKLYLPPPRPHLVLRPRLIARLNEGLAGRLTLVSAPAGFGKTTLVSSWLATLRSPDRPKGTGEPGRQSPKRHAKIIDQVAWLSLDDGDNDPARFLAYLVAAVQTIAPQLGEGVLRLLQAPQPPPIEAMLTNLLNEIVTIPHDFVLVLDDYHVIEAQPAHHILGFLLEHLPPRLHLVIATREDPALPLARLRARGQLAEVRVADLRFTLAEATDFLNQGMDLNLAAEAIAALENRTEGWIAGLQLAAISMQGQQDPARFIQSFTGSHRFVMDYLVEEVLHQQPAHIQDFLLHTSLLNRLCGPLCDAVIGGSPPSEAILASIEQANLFIIPLDNERRWYRYHHLFAELLRQRLQQRMAATPADAEKRINELHIRASQWYEDNGLELEAFHHATAAKDIARAERLIEGQGIPLHLRGAVVTILNWFATLPPSVLNARPSLWWRYASLLLVNGQTTGVAEKLQAAEDALPHDAQEAMMDDQTRLLIGRIATARAVLALTRYQVATMMAQARRALAYLPSTHLSLRANATWTLGYAYLFAGDRPAARQALMEAIALGQAAKDVFITILATIGLGSIEEAENQLYQAAETYRRVLQLAGDQPLQIICEAHLGLARICYEWNELAAAAEQGQQSLHLARQYDKVIDRFILSEIFLVRLKLAHDDVAGAAALLAQTQQSVRQPNFAHRLPEVTTAQVLVLLRQDQVAAAAELAQAHPLPISQARVYLAQANPTAALAVLASFCQESVAKGETNEQLKAMVLQALAYQAQGEQAQAVQRVGEALALAEPGGCIRLFVDEGPPMARLLSVAATQGVQPAYIRRLLASFAPAAQMSTPPAQSPPALAVQPLLEPLSPRELEVLGLIAQGLSNQEISERLFLALSTVKGHNRLIFDKLHVQRRTEAIARARALGIL